MKRSIFCITFWIFFVGSILCIASFSAEAVPALEYETTFRQPNGVSFQAVQRGDEFSHYLETEDGEILGKNPDGTWVYAGSNARYLIDPAPEQRHVLAQKWREQGTGLTPSLSEESVLPNGFARQSADAQLLTGDQTLLVILVDFSDRSFSATNSSDADWSEKIFGQSNSVKDFYQTMTNGKVKIFPAKETHGVENDGIVHVKINEKHPNNTSASISPKITALAIKSAARYVDFASYDTNKNGKIEAKELHIMVICAGFEESVSRTATPSVWGHQYDGLSVYGKLANDKSFSSYTQFGELHYGAEIPMGPATIGIICHEFGHDLGLPDLYTSADVNRNIPIGLGGYSLMAHGSWGSADENSRIGSTPVGFDAYCLELLNAAPVEVVSIGSNIQKNLYSLSQGNSKNILKIELPDYEHLYFLMENRQLELYDKGMKRFMSSTAQGGIAVYRVDRNYEDNLDTKHPAVTILEANSSITNVLLQNGRVKNDALFYKKEGRTVGTVLNRTTKPSTVLSNNDYGWFSFECLSESSSTMSVQIRTLVTLSPRALVMDYKEVIDLNVSYSDGPQTWTVADPSVIAFDTSKRKITAKKPGTTTLKISDNTGSDVLSVKVRYNLMQWLIIIFLFGWIWY